MRHTILGGKVQLYKRGEGSHWQCAASYKGRQYRATTKEDGLEKAKEVAEDWYLELRGKVRAGVIKTEKTFAEAADLFLKEYQVITEGHRSPKWIEGHRIRVRLHLKPFFGEMGVSEVTPGKVQEYRVHRATTPPDYSLSPTYERAGKTIAVKQKEFRPPSRSTLHDEIVTLRLVLKTAIRHQWLSHLPDLSPPYKTQGKVGHRPWFSPAEYKQLYEGARAYRNDSNPYHRWSAEQVYDYILFMGNTGLRPDEAKRLQHRDVTIIDDEATGERILSIEVRGKVGYGPCKSMPGAVRVYDRLRNRPKQVLQPGRRKRKQGGVPAPVMPELPQPTDLIFPGNHIKLFNGLLTRLRLKVDREGKPRTAYSLRHTYISMRLMEGADVYQIAKNCRTSIEMIQKFYASHISTVIDASAINMKRPKPRKRGHRRVEPLRSSPPPADDFDDREAV